MKTLDSICPAEELLSAHLDGDLSAEDERAVAQHLGNCSACSAVLEELSALRRDLGRLAEPGPDLWPAIALRLQPSESLLARLRRMWLLPAAAFAGAAAAVLAIWFFARPAERPREPLRALQAVIAAETTYRDAIASLEGALGEQPAGFSAEVQTEIARGLADIDNSISRCREALARDPNNLKAHETMLAAYQHKVDFLTELVGNQ